MSSQQTIEIKPGWNWISFCVKNVKINDLDIICDNNDADFIYGDFIIKSETQTAYYYSYKSWLGSLQIINPSLPNTTKSFLYLFYSKYSVNIQVNGDPIIDKVYYIDLKWNWLGYSYTEDKYRLNDILTNIPFTKGDIIKSFNETAYYCGDTIGWLGIEFLEKGKGYMLFHSNTDDLISTPEPHLNLF